jgi:hypothetical protein
METTLLKKQIEKKNVRKKIEKGSMEAIERSVKFAKSKGLDFSYLKK